VSAKSANRIREAGHLNEIRGVVASTLKYFAIGPPYRVSSFTLVGFNIWLDVFVLIILLFKDWPHKPPGQSRFRRALKGGFGIASFMLDISLPAELSKA
jgi:hypothetical protein